jgi:hypothetical protein
LVKKKEDILNSSLYRWKTKKALETTTAEKKDQYQQYLAEDPIDAPLPNQEDDEEGNEADKEVVISY